MTAYEFFEQARADSDWDMGRSFGGRVEYGCQELTQCKAGRQQQPPGWSCAPRLPMTEHNQQSTLHCQAFVLHEETIPSSFVLLHRCSLNERSLVPSQAFVLYEESIPDSRQEVRALQSIMGTLNRWVGAGACLRRLSAALFHKNVSPCGNPRPGLCTCLGYYASAPEARAALRHKAASRCLGSHTSLTWSAPPSLRRCYAIAPEERAALCHKAASYCAKLLKRADQCQAVLACSHLHWQAEKEVRSGAL